MTSGFSVTNVIYFIITLCFRDFNHAYKSRANIKSNSVEYKSTIRAKRYLNPLHRHFGNTMKEPPFC